MTYLEFGETMDPTNCCLRLFGIKINNNQKFLVANYVSARFQHALISEIISSRDLKYAQPYLRYGKKVFKGLHKAC